MALRRRAPEPPCVCGCEQLEARLAGYEATIAAMARALVALRPIARHHDIVTGLTGWGVTEADARQISHAYRQRKG